MSLQRTGAIRRRPRLLMVAALVCAACGSSSETPEPAPLPAPDGGMCAADQFLYDDFSCPPPGSAMLDAGFLGMQCSHEGDSLCHQRCTVDADCKASSRPYCRIRGLYAGYDSNCNVGVRICEQRDRDPADCIQTPAVLR